VTKFGTRSTVVNVKRNLASRRPFQMFTRLKL
jgi:hypothetical protein